MFAYQGFEIVPVIARQGALVGAQRAHRDSGAWLFGIPEADRERFRGWLTTLFKGAGGAARAEDESSRVKECTEQLLGDVGPLVGERRKHPGDDVISRFLSDPAGQDVSEVTMQCHQVIVAGCRTSTNRIANTVLALARHPEALARLRADPGLLHGAVEKGLR